MKKYLLGICAILTIALLSFSLSMASPQSALSNDTGAGAVETDVTDNDEPSNDAEADSTTAGIISSYEFLNKNSISQMPERDELFSNATSLEERLNSQDIAIFEADGSTTNYKTTDGDFRVAYDSMYKIYGVNPEWLTALNAGEQSDFQKYITDTYIWEVPVYDRGGTLVTSAGFRKGMTYSEYLEIKPNLPISGEEQEKDIDQFIRNNENKWYWTRTGNMIACEDIAFLTNTDGLAKYIDSFGFRNIEDIRYVSIDSYILDFLYIRADGDEYAIPFAQRSEFLENGIENRVLCEVDRVLEVAAKIVEKDRLVE